MKLSSKQMAILAAVLCGAAAVIWTILAALHLIFGESPPWLIALNFLCCLVWWIAFAVQMIRWRCAVKK